MADEPVTEACSESVALNAPQPLSRSVKVATPVLVLTLAGVSVARPCDTQAEDTDTLTGVPGAVPFRRTVSRAWP